MDRRGGGGDHGEIERRVVYGQEGGGGGDHGEIERRVVYGQEGGEETMER